MSLLRKTSNYIMLLFMLLLFLVPVKAEAATVGAQLENPEIGWQRFDDTNSNFKYSGKWSNINLYRYWNGSCKLYNGGGASTISFKFYGSKLRIIGDTSTMNATNNIIIIDNDEYTFSEVGTTTYRVLVYEKSGLDLGVHTVVIKSPPTKNLIFDAIDIDDTGYLVPFSQAINLEAVTGDATVNLKWTVTQEATNFDIKRSTTPGGPYTTIDTTTKTTYEDTDVSNGTTYYYVISSTNSEAETINSNEVLATPTAAQVSPSTDTKLKVVLEVSEKLQLSVDDDLSVNTEMVWSSSDNTVATVSANGVVTAFALGNTVITVTSVDGTYTDHINVLVVENASEYRLAIDLTVGQSARLTVDDLTDTVKVTWALSDTSIATISSKGKVTAVRKGLTLATVINEEGDIIGQVYVRVRE